MIEINRSTFEQIDNWADKTIEQFKSAMRNEKTYLRWSDRRLYSTQDTWIDENWWYQAAEYLFNKQDKMFDGLGGIAPLEILVFYNPEKYKEIAIRKIDKWYSEQGLNDPEYWWDLAGVVAPDHPFILELLEDTSAVREIVALANMGHTKAIEHCRDFIFDSPDRPDTQSSLDELYFFGDLHRQIFLEVLGTQENYLHQQAIKLVSQQENVDREYVDCCYNLLSPAISLDWSDVIDLLSSNQLSLNYLHGLITDFDRGIYQNQMILDWSLTSQKELTQKLILTFIKTYGFIYEIGVFGRQPKKGAKFSEYGFFNRRKQQAEMSMAIAVAWKRSTS